MAGRLDGKVALVMGAGASGPGWGNGKAAAVLFAREGARVFCVDLVLEAVVEERPLDGIDALPGGGRYTLPAFLDDPSDDDVN